MHLSSRARMDLTSMSSTRNCKLKRAAIERRAAARTEFATFSALCDVCVGWFICEASSAIVVTVHNGSIERMCSSVCRFTCFRWRRTMRRRPSLRRLPSSRRSPASCAPDAAAPSPQRTAHNAAAHDNRSNMHRHRQTLASLLSISLVPRCVCTRADLVHVALVLLHPSLRSDVVHIDGSSRVRISVRSMVDGSLAQLDSVVHGQIVLEARVEDSVGVGGAGSHGEPLSLESRSVIVMVKQLRSVRLVPSCNHRADGQSAAAVLVENVAKNLRSGCNADARALTKLVNLGEGGEEKRKQHTRYDKSADDLNRGERRNNRPICLSLVCVSGLCSDSALERQISLPEAAVRGTTSHGPQQIR